jgi:hypothetical protein
MHFSFFLGGMISLGGGVLVKRRRFYKILSGSLTKIILCLFAAWPFFWPALAIGVLARIRAPPSRTRTHNPARQQPPVAQLPAVHPVWPIFGRPAPALQREQGPDERRLPPRRQIVIESDPRAASRSPTRPGLRSDLRGPPSEDGAVADWLIHSRWCRRSKGRGA